jgi:hypothetical protein
LSSPTIAVTDKAVASMVINRSFNIVADIRATTGIGYHTVSISCTIITRVVSCGNCYIGCFITDCSLLDH